MGSQQSTRLGSQHSTCIWPLKSISHGATLVSQHVDAITCALDIKPAVLEVAPNKPAVLEVAPKPPWGRKRRRRSRRRRIRRRRRSRRIRRITRRRRTRMRRRRRRLLGGQVQLMHGQRDLGGPSQLDLGEVSINTTLTMRIGSIELVRIAN